MKRNFSLNAKIGLIVGGMMLQILTMVTANYVVNTQRAGDGVAINVAGRQRMLAQKYVKELLAEIVKAPGQSGVSDARKTTIAVFESSSQALRSGGKAPASLKQDSFVEVAIIADAQAQEALANSASNWEALQREALTLRTMTPGAAGFGEHLAQVMDLGTAAVVAADKATNRIQAVSDGRSALLSNIQLSMLAIAVFMFVLTLFYTRRSVVGPLSKTMEDLEAASESIAQSSKQIADSSVSLSDGASSQASAFEETTASLMSLAHSVKKNTEDSHTASELMQETASLVETGARSASEMKVAMSEISSATDNTSRIIKSIDEIAFQTNLLALNAAVEAARAGETGKGFAVVAEEVRSLAIRSASAARDTSDLIQGTLNSVSKGVNVIKTLESVLRDTTDSSKQAALVVHQITASIEEQTSAIDQVNSAMAQINTVIQSNAGHSEESAASAEELASHAEVSLENVSNMRKLVMGG